MFTHVFLGQISSGVDVSDSLLPPWWQILGAFLLVIALLFLFLRLLNRMQAGHAAHNSGLLENHNLGSGRRVEVVRFREGVYTIYRHDTAAVLLDKSDSESYEPPEPKHPVAGLRIPFLEKYMRK